MKWHGLVQSGHTPDFVTGTSAVFTGVSEYTYYFYSIARDNVGHIEESPGTCDAHTTVYVPYICGDIDAGVSIPDVADLTYLVAYLFQSGTPLPVLEAANVEGENGINIADLKYMVTHLFPGGPEPDCQPIQ